MEGAMILYFFMTKLCILFLGDRVLTILFLSRGVGRNLLPEERFPIPPLKKKNTSRYFWWLYSLIQIFSRHLIVPDGDYLAGSRPKIKGEQLHSKGCVQYSPYSRLNWFETWSYLLDLKINVKYTTFIFFSFRYLNWIKICEQCYQVVVEDS